MLDGSDHAALELEPEILPAIGAVDLFWKGYTLTLTIPRNVNIAGLDPGRRSRRARPQSDDWLVGVIIHHEVEVAAKCGSRRHRCDSKRRNNQKPSRLLSGPIERLRPL